MGQSYILYNVSEQTLPPAAVTQFNVLTYGAAGDGVTNDAPAIQAAYTAAHAYSAGGLPSMVYFPPQTYLVSTGWNLPTIRTNDWYGQTSPTVQRAGIVTFSGYGATIKYSSANTRFCWLQGPNPTTQYTTYGNIVIEGFTIDNNWRQPSGQCGDIMWVQGDGNVDNVVVRDVTMTANITARTLATQSATVNGLLIIPSHMTRNQSHYSYVTNITVEDSTTYGQGKAIGIYAGDRGLDTTYGASKMLYDNITIARCYANTLNHYGSNIHLGSYAAGYRCTVIDTTCTNSSDDGLEIDAFNEVTVSGCDFSACRQPICFTWFSFPYLGTTPTYTVTDCHYSGDCSSYWENGVTPEPGNRSPMMPEFLDGGRTELNTRDHGHLVISNCTGEFGVTNSYSIHRGFIQSNSRLASVTISGVDITDVGTGGSLLVISQNAAGGTLPISVHTVRWRSSVGGAYVLLPLSKCTFGGSYTLDTDMT